MAITLQEHLYRGPGSPDWKSFEEDKLWLEIRRAAKTNQTLQNILDSAILTYQLSKTNAAE